jgi:D-xylose transport system substrate-binding protein
MRKILALAAILASAACDQRAAITELARCSRELGSADQRMAQAQAAQAAAERRTQVLEEEVRGLRQELAAARSGGGAAPAAAPQGEALAEAPPLAPPAPEPAAGKRGGLRVGLSLHGQNDERWVKDKLTMLAEAKRRGIDLRVQVGDQTAEKQQAQCEDLFAQGIKVLILSAQDATAAAAIIDKANKAGVQVICYDRLVLNSLHDYYYLSFDSVKVGELQGENLARRVPKGNYVFLRGDTRDNNARLVFEGQMKALKPLIDRGAISVVLDESVPNWSAEGAQQRCEKVIAAGTRVDAVASSNDQMAGGCVKALEAHGLAGKVPVTGQDAELAAAIRVLQGTQSMTVLKDTRDLGKRAIEMAELLARGKPVATGQTVSNNKRQVKAVLLTPYLIDKENLDQRLVQTGYLNRAAVYRK